MLIDMEQDGYELETFDTIEAVEKYLEDVYDSEYERILIKGSEVGIRRILVVDKQ